MKTGIVMEIAGRKAVVLCSSGAFLSVPAAPHWQRGDVVHLPRQRAPLLALAACLALVLSLGAWQLYFTETARISIDVNPSIELGLNRMGRVIDASGRNREGEQILAQITPRGKPYGTVVAALLAQESQSGYLGAEADVVVTVFSANAARQAALLRTVEASTDAALETHHRRGAEYHTVDAATAAQARACGVSAGKYLYLAQLQSAAPDIDIAAYTHHSIPQLRQQIRACQSEHGAARAGDGERGTHVGSGHEHGGCAT